MKKAFSLIELSIVILIIGILIAGVTQSSRLVRQFRIRTAQTLTQSSPVAGIKDLMAWYETSSDASFISTEAQDNTAISAWNDISPQSAFKITATQGTPANQPIYFDNMFNGALPGIRFDGVNDNLAYDGSGLIGSSYTIFVVEQKRNGAGSGWFVSGTASIANSTLIFGYRTNTDVTQDQFTNGIDYVNGVLAFVTPTPRMHTFRMGKDVGQGKSYWLNGGTNPEQSDNTQITPLAIYTSPSIGGGGGSVYFGDIAEIIIFTRALKTEERQAVETYLGKKYNIIIS